MVPSFTFDVNEIDEAALQEVVNDFEQQQFNYLLVGNKVDIEQNAIRKFEKFSNTLFISAKGQQNITHLKTELVSYHREHIVARAASLVTFQNIADRNEFIFRTHYSIDRTVIIPGNIGPPRFTPKWQNKNTSTGVKNLIYVGNLSVSKGLRYLLEALAILKDRGYMNLKLFILGKPDEKKEIETIITRLNISNMVSIEGYQLPFPYFVKCDLLVYPSLYDAFPDAVLEALHAGCPVIASAVGGLPDILVAADLLFPIADSLAIADKIECAIKDPEYYQKIRILCAKRAQVYQFDWAEAFENAMKAGLPG